MRQYSLSVTSLANPSINAFMPSILYYIQKSERWSFVQNPLYMLTSFRPKLAVLRKQLIQHNLTKRVKYKFLFNNSYLLFSKSTLTITAARACPLPLAMQSIDIIEMYTYAYKVKPETLH